jgi:hypothetical protein
LCQNGGLSVLSSIGGTEESREGRETTVMLFLVKTSLMKKEVWYGPNSFVVKFRGVAFAHFHSVAVKRHNSMRNWLFGVPGRILCEQSPWCKRNDEHALDFASTLTWLCPEPSMPIKHPCTANAFFFKRLSNQCKGLRHSFPNICTTCDAVPLSDTSWNCVRPDTRLQIKGRKKNRHVHPSAWNLVHWLPRHASAIIYSCIALIQLLYRWHHQSRKLWIPTRIDGKCKSRREQLDFSTDSIHTLS